MIQFTSCGTKRKKDSQIPGRNLFIAPFQLFYFVLELAVPLGDGLFMQAVEKSLEKAGITSATTHLGVGLSTPFPLIEDQTPLLSIPSGTNLLF